MSLQRKLDRIHQNILTDAPEEATAFDADTQQMIQQGIGRSALQTGDRAPDFRLPDPLGRETVLNDLLVENAVVLSFYRGSWCPYCNMELHTLQQHLPEIERLGAKLVAISPQVPDESLSTAEKHELTFPVLSDVGNQVARQFGLVFTLSEHLRPMYARFGIDLPSYNGDSSFELPVPATFVLNREGIVRSAFVNADYKQRMEPEEILRALVSINSTQAGLSVEASNRSEEVV